jgi:outer membrane PBP1 activator LpoA protein
MSALVDAQRQANTDSAMAAQPSLPVRKFVLLLPTEQPLLRRAAIAVRDGVRAALAKSGVAIELRDCGYGPDGIVGAYRRCVVDDIDAVIGPLGRSDVSALAAAETALPIHRPTLMLSPLGAMPPRDFYVLAPELESEAEAIARQSLEDACRKPVLVEASGAIATRVSVAVTAYFKSGGVGTPLVRHELGSRERWHSVAEGWRRSGVDCVIFAGSGVSFGELRPFLRNITSYITSASYETELDRIADWTGVRIADMPFLLDPTRSDFAVVAHSESVSPTLTRLFALGVDAARIALQASEADSTDAGRTMPVVSEPGGVNHRGVRAQSFAAPTQFDGAIGRLQLRDGQYQRSPAIGEFRGRAPVALGQ